MIANIWGVAHHTGCHVRRSWRGEGGWGRTADRQGDHVEEGDNQIPGESGAQMLMPRLAMALRLLVLSGHQWSLSSVLSPSGSSGSPNLSCGYFLCSGMLNWSRHPGCPLQGGVRGRSEWIPGLLVGLLLPQSVTAILAPVTLLISFTLVLGDPGVNAAGGGAPSPFQDFPLRAGLLGHPLPGPVLTGQRFSLWATCMRLTVF